MKITLNLAVAPTLRERYALAWAVPTTIVALVVMVWLAHSTWANVRRARGLEAKLADAQQREQKLTQREMELRRDFDRPDIRGLLEKTQLINGLIDKKRLSFTALVMNVADLLPPDARLSGVALARSGDGSAVRFQVNSKAPQPLETFLANLAKSPDFADPVVTSEGFEQPQGATGASTGEVTVTCTARYIGQPGVEGAPPSDNAQDEAGGPSNNPASEKANKQTGGKASGTTAGRTGDRKGGERAHAQ